MVERKKKSNRNKGEFFRELGEVREQRKLATEEDPKKKKKKPFTWRK